MSIVLAGRPDRIQLPRTGGNGGSWCCRGRVPGFAVLVPCRARRGGLAGAKQEQVLGLVSEPAGVAESRVHVSRPSRLAGLAGLAGGTAPAGPGSGGGWLAAPVLRARGEWPAWLAGALRQVLGVTAGADG